MRKLLFALTAATVLGAAVPASAQIYVEHGYGYRGWWGGAYHSYGYHPGVRVFIGPRRHFYDHYGYYGHRGWRGGY